MEEKNLTGYPSIDKPWLKYYSEEAIQIPLPECSIFEYLWENNKNHLDNIALVYFGNHITYRELFQRIDETARAFAAHGLGPGMVCTVISLSCVNSVVTFYALNKIGAISNYINVLSSEDEFERYFREANSDYIVSLDLFAGRVLPAAKKAGAKKVILFSLSDGMSLPAQIGYKVKFRKANLSRSNSGNAIMWKDFLKSAKSVHLPSRAASEDGVSIWAHTGGTTGFPKTVLLTDKAYNSVALQYMKTMKYERGEVFLNIIVPFVVYGMLTCMHMPLCLGLTVALIPKFEAADWSSYIKKYRPNHIAGIPTYFSPMLDDPKLTGVDLSRIKTLAAGGDGMNESLEMRLNRFLESHGSTAIVIKGYGMTEVCSSAVTAWGEHSKIGSVGFPLVKNCIKIFDKEKKEECRYGEIGEILLSSPSLMVGYKDNEKATNDLISVDNDGEKWVHTEDLGYVDEDGFLFLLGRMKRVILVGPEGMAYKVFPKTIEDVIQNMDEILNVCVVSAHNGNDLAAIAFVIPAAEYAGNEVQLREKIEKLCAAELPDYMRPFAYEFVQSFPATSVGKTDYQALERMAEERS